MASTSLRYSFKYPSFSWTWSKSVKKETQFHSNWCKCTCSFINLSLQWKQVSFGSCSCFNRSITFHNNQNLLSHRVVNYVRNPITAPASGLQASISDADDNVIALKDAKIVVESRDQNKIQLRVDVTGIETEKVFDKVLTDLARQAPSIPGFRRAKGGKTTKENLNVEDNKVSTSQTTEELKISFTP